MRFDNTVDVIIMHTNIKGILKAKMHFYRISD